MFLFAHDKDDNRVYIDDTHSNSEYYCPYCGATLIVRQGDIRHHHFAHKSHHECSDTWSRNGYYDDSSWHNDWQSRFPKENQEIKLNLGQTAHRADVMIDRSVIEFQHSVMSPDKFDDRNNFYLNLGYKVIWLFDLSDLFESGKITYEKREGGLHFRWSNPKKAFSRHDVQNGYIDLFFQLKNSEEKCLIRVKEVSAFGFEEFDSTELLDKNDFLEYVGLSGGVCDAPYRDDPDANKAYLEFKEKYNIQLNKQQERALQSVKGANLLLSVPGSGKTTVLVARIGYMILVKGIDPAQILAITFNKIAAEEMRQRFEAQFGRELSRQVQFRTINSLSLEIYKKYCARNNKIVRMIDRTNNKTSPVRQTFQKYHPKENATQNDIVELEAAFAYIKNMMLSDEQIDELDADIPDIKGMFSDYCALLKSSRLMDFNDQMVFADYALQNDAELLDEYKRKYRYICVDEAQDTSKIQHKIIKRLAEGGNLFMVGDEDQSIYGFRAAYPRALLNFRYDYINPYILRMETNYRSTKQIVDFAQKFISRNKGRYEKKMTSARDEGEDVSLVHVKTREEQFNYLLDAAKNRQKKVAFLYRENNSAIVLIDLLLRNDIPFVLKKPEKNFFEDKTVSDIMAYLKLSLNCRDVEKHISVFDALDDQMKYVPLEYKNRSEKFRIFMNAMSGLSPVSAIEHICDGGYKKYLEKNAFLDESDIGVLKMIASHERDIGSFIQRIEELKAKYEQGFRSDDPNAVVLSTIHSSKGLEYDTVYIVDVYDGRFPSSMKNTFSRSKDSADGEQEERRMFYVGITRAQNKLVLINIENRPSEYLAEMFPSEYVFIEDIPDRDLPAADISSAQSRVSGSNDVVVIKSRSAQTFPNYEAAVKRNMERRKQEKLDKECYHKVCDKFTQQEKPIRDHTGRRWIKCEKCGEIKPEAEFITYGGAGRVNLGTCKACWEKKRTAKDQTDTHPSE